MRRTLLAMFLALLFSPMALAEPFDPQAQGLALEWLPIYQKATESGDLAPFVERLAADPLLTRKVYLSTLHHCHELYLADQKAALVEWYGFAKAMAIYLHTKHADQQAFKIIQAFDAQRYEEAVQLEHAYAQTLYPGFVGPPTKVRPGFVALLPTVQKYSEFEIRPGNWTAEEREHWKGLYWLLRAIELSQAYACLDQSITQAQLATAEIERLSSLSTDYPVLLAHLDVLQSGVDMTRISNLAELGLLEEASGLLSPLLARGGEQRGYRAAALLSCARAALLQGDAGRAGELLKQARDRLEGLFVAPALRFSISTADYQLRRLKGYRPTPGQRVQDFRQAWREAFTGYQPFSRVHADAFWGQGRKALRFWLRELDPAETEAAEARADLDQELQAWFTLWTERSRELSQSEATADDWLYNPEHTGNFLSAAMAMQDVSVALVEDLPGDSSRRAAFVADYPAILTQAQLWAELYTYKEAAFSVTESGLLPELRGRLNMMKAQQSTRPAQERLELTEQAVTAVARCGDPEAQVRLLLDAGENLKKLGRSELAIARWEEAVLLAERLTDVELALRATTLLAQEYAQLEQWEKATTYADEASHWARESVMLAVGDPQAVRNLARANDQVVVVSVQAALGANKPEVALAALERGKGVAVASEQLQSDSGAIVVAVAVQQKQEQVATLSAQVLKLEGMPASTDRDQLLQKTESLLADTKADFLLRGRELRQQYPELYSRVLKVDPLDLPDLQKVLPPDAAVVQYFPTTDALYIFVMTKEAFRLRSVPVSVSELDNTVNSFVRGIRRFRPGDAQLAADSKRLYGHLIQPCQADLESKSVLVLIPTGRLNVVPFACLQAGGAGEAVLIDKKVVVEVGQPADFFRLSISPTRQAQSVVAFANATGDLPAAAKEGEQIAALFPEARLFQGAEASKQNLLAFGDKAEILHLATHGELNSSQALSNYLKMSKDEKVGQEEIFALDLSNTSLVTLSACNTAMGDTLEFRFVSSLAEAFWLAGSQSVMASLWAVNDASTALLMTEFYQGLREGKPRAQALRDAQVKVKSTPGYEHPYFWAGFMLFGDWR